jgi:hypothetical protein
MITNSVLTDIIFYKTTEIAAKQRFSVISRAGSECVKSVRQERIKRIKSEGTEEKNLPICLIYLVFTENDYLSFA